MVVLYESIEVTGVGNPGDCSRLGVDVEAVRFDRMNVSDRGLDNRGPYPVLSSFLEELNAAEVFAHILQHDRV